MALKIQLLSDVHTEFHHHFPEGKWYGRAKKDFGQTFIRRLNPQNVDVLVLAGDIALGYDIPRVLSAFARRFKKAKVIYVHGNHEHYGQANTFQRVWGETIDVCDEHDNLIWLNDGVCTIQGQRFVGTCMWYPDTTEAVLLRKRWSDFSAIPGAGKRIFSASKQAVRFLEQEVREGDVVSTHMLPSAESTRKNY